MLNDINRFAIVLNVEVSRVCGNGNLLDWVCGVSCAKSHNLVVGVHKEFVDKLVEAGIDLKCTFDKLIAFTNKHFFLYVRDTTNVGIWK